MLKATLITTSIFTAIASQAVSQDLPKFDGIYLGLKDGTFEKLNPFTGKRIIISDFGSGKANEYGVAQEFVPVIVDGVALQPDILSAVFFDSENAESIFIRSRSIRLNFIENVVPIEGLFFDFSFDPDNLRREAFYERLALEFPGVSGTKCGVQASALNLLNETETTYQYFFEGSKLLDQNGDDVQLFYRESNGCFVGRTTDATKSLGLLLSTNSGNFLLLETDAMNAYYMSPNLSGWTELPELTRKIEVADR